MVTEYFRSDNIDKIPIDEVVEWTKGGGPGRLLLPPIQRSVVWENGQIINYWDSLLRGYPAGLMTVHRSQAKQGDTSKGRTAYGQTCEAHAEDFHLFDGQQRISAILLGHQTGQLHTRVKLWVDLGVAPSDESSLRFQLRISSTGQPFGYQAQTPNQKPPLDKRRKQIGEWVKANNPDSFDSLKAFEAVEGKDLIGAVCAMPLHEVLDLLSDVGLEQTIDKLERQWPNVPPDRIKSFVQALDRALKAPIIFQLIDQKMVEDEKEYIRYFGRLGQGGTPLSNDELTYSIIKHQYPEVHDRMRAIMDGPAGRVASEVNLVLAALRVAKVLSPWENAGEWEVISRPSPGFVSRLKEFPSVWKEFQKLIPTTQGGGLKELLESIRGQLVYEKSKNPGGLPVMLLARLPHQLVDVLLLIATQQKQFGSVAGKPDKLAPFVLHWLLFIGNHDKAANWVFIKWHNNPGLIVGQQSIQGLIQDFEKEGIARVMPFKAQLRHFREEIEKRDHLLHSWSERFARLDADVERKTGDALRVLSTDKELIKHVLMWLQRDYLGESYRHFDPTSSRDEDLPVDLDHLIPYSLFGIDWRLQQKLVDLPDSMENFGQHRHLIGNSLGNYRWLDAAENRGRGAREIEVLENDWDFVKDADAWNRLIRKAKKKSPWNTHDVAAFQKLIDLRTLDVYEKLLVHGGLDFIASDGNSKLSSPEA